MATYDVDVVVLGLGPGGEYAAQKLAEAGLDVVGVERDLVGGECPFYGCIPSKMMIRAADALAEARRVDAPGRQGRGHARLGRGRDPDRQAGDQPLARRLPRRAARGGRGAHRPRRGTARRHRHGPGGGGRLRRARAAWCSTSGPRPRRLPIDGLAETPYWTNREIVKVAELPASLAIIGGGADRLRAGPGLRPVRLAGDRARDGRPAAGARRSPSRASSIEQVFARRGHPGRDRHHHRAGRPRRRLHDHHRPRRRSRPTSCSWPPAARSTCTASASTPSASTPTAGRVDDRRADARRRAAVGGRRHHRPRPVHPRLDVPGRDRGARHARPGRLHRRLPRRDPGDLHRPRGRRRSA